MAKNGRRYDGRPKLNMKKVFGVALIFILIIACIVGIVKLLSSNSKSLAGKIENVCYYTIYDNGKWGVIDSYGDIIIKPTYDEMIVIPDAMQDIFICTYEVDYGNNNYKTKVINKKGKEIIKDYNKIEAIANYDDNHNIWYEKNVFKVEKDGKYGLINYSGKKLLNTEYSNINPIFGVENSLVIEKDGKYGLCDDSGNIVIDINYKRIERVGNDYRNGYIVVDENNKYGIIGFDKSKILDTKYEEIKGICGENLYAVKENGKYIVINKAGEKKVNKEFEDILEINKDNIVAKNSNGKFGVVGMDGQTRIDFDYDSLKGTNENSFIAKKGDKYGIVNIDGNVALPIESKNVEYIASGDCIVANYVENGKEISRVYNSNIEEKIVGDIKEINTSKGYIRVSINDEYKYYNFKFEERAASEVLTSNKLFLSKKDGKYGFIDASGKVVVDYQYDDATEQNISGYAGIKKEGLWGSIDLNGKVVVEPKYNLDNNKRIDFVGAWHLCEDTNANYYLDA
ncbi:MAG: WG repeat-containing protein [Clostridia bacterium]|nr:WG repeat-containing protein [Clostridia bacterium]